jgi:hypothetical protein
LLDRGMSPKKAAILLYGICSIVAIFSLFESVVHNNAVSSVIVLLFCAVALIGIQYLGYTEFSVAGKMLFGGGLQRNLKIQLDLGAFRKSVANARTAAECATLVEESAAKFGLIATHLRIAGQDFAGPPGPAGAQWGARVNIDGGDWIEVARVPDAGAGAALFLDALADCLAAKVETLTANHAKDARRTPAATVVQ